MTCACTDIHVTFTLKAYHPSKREHNVEETDPFTQTGGEWTTCREQASVKQTSGRIFICVFQCCRWIVIVKCDKALAALLVIIIQNNNNTVRKVYVSEHFKDGFYLHFLNAATVRDIHICTRSTSCQTAHTCFCDLFRFHWRNPQHYWQGCL